MSHRHSLHSLTPKQDYTIKISFYSAHKKKCKYIKVKRPKPVQSFTICQVPLVHMLDNQDEVTAWYCHSSSCCYGDEDELRKVLSFFRMLLRRCR